ncbi:30S ribosomal protein S17 [Candidatus Shapirobacteria bacterium]|nr:30S ribosomal protein S17 [Candidatus Shapirobacteria bacterium]
MSKGRVFNGTVVAVSGPKTITVVVEDFYRHPLYKKTLRRRKKYLVHAEREVAVGEKVKIRESRPLSKRKRFVLEGATKEDNLSTKKEGDFSENDSRSSSL